MTFVFGDLRRDAFGPSDGWMVPALVVLRGMFFEVFGFGETKREAKADAVKAAQQILCFPDSWEKREPHKRHLAKIVTTLDRDEYERARDCNFQEELP